MFWENTLPSAYAHYIEFLELTNSVHSPVIAGSPPIPFSNIATCHDLVLENRKGYRQSTSIPVSIFSRGWDQRQLHIRDERYQT